MSCQDFLATPLSLAAERSPEEPLPESSAIVGHISANPPAPPKTKAASPGVLKMHRTPSAAAVQKEAAIRNPKSMLQSSPLELDTMKKDRSSSGKLPRRQVLLGTAAVIGASAARQTAQAGAVYQGWLILEYEEQDPATEVPRWIERMKKSLRMTIPQICADTRGSRL